MFEQPLAAHAGDGLERVLDDRLVRELEASIARLRRVLAGRSLWHVNSTGVGGGVAEMLTTLLPYLRAADISVHWAVIEGDSDFFRLTKRLHNWLHEQPGDNGDLGPAERATYEATLLAQAAGLLARVRPGDLVMLHDPQTAGLAPLLADRGVRVVWRCHIGTDDPAELARAAWNFLRTDVDRADALVFSRAAYAWDGLANVTVITPCIDVLSPKNAPFAQPAARAMLTAAGLLERNGAAREEPTGRPATILGGLPVPVDAPLVLQVSRWDRLKGCAEVVAAFDDAWVTGGAHLMVAGPEIGTISDDPESAGAFATVKRAWEQLSAKARRHVHVASLPMEDPTANARLVNALQRHAAVVAQKSVQEGFGLTVAEAMWKQRPVVATRVGGIQDQIVHGKSGLLVDDPHDLDAFADAVTTLLRDSRLALEIGGAARERVCEHFLPVHHFAAEASLFERITA